MPPQKEHKLAHTSIRFKESLLRNIDIYSTFRGITRNEAIEELLEYGNLVVMQFELLQKFKADLENRWVANSGNLPTFKIFNTELFLKRDNNQCQKCGKAENLELFHINRNPTDFKITNVITLCHDCAERAKAYIPNEYLEPAFVVWFYLIKDF